MPTVRTAASATLGGDGRIYVIGGQTSIATEAGVTTVEAYIPTVGMWSKASSLLTARTALTSNVAGDGRVVAIGGLDETGTTLSSVEAYGPVFTVGSMHASPGTMLSAQGSNFAANATVTVTISTQPPMLLGTATTDDKGVLAPFTFVVPTVPQTCCGYPLVAVDSHSRYRVSWPFAVDE